MDILLAFATFTLVFPALSFAARHLSRSAVHAKHVGEQLESIGAQEDGGRISIIRDSQPEEGRLIYSLFPANLTRSLQRAIWHAGLFMRVSEFLLIVAVAICLGLGLGSYVFHDQLIPPLLGLSAGALPVMYLRYRTRRRLKAFNQQLPHALDLIKSSLEAGHSLQRALQVVVSEFGDPISGELRIVTEQARIGLPLPTALENMTERVPDEDLRLLTVAVSVQSEVGSSLAQIIERISELVRVRQRLHLQIHAMTAQSRMSGIIVGLLPVIVLGVFSVIKPGYFTDIVRDPTGMMLLKAAVGLDAMALCSIRYLLKVSY